MDNLLTPIVTEASGNAALDPTQSVAGDAQDTLLLPEDVIRYCLSFLVDEKDVNNFALASKTCLRIASDPVLWRSLLPLCRSKLWAALDEEQRERAVCSMYRGHLDPLVCAGSFCYSGQHCFYSEMAVDGDAIAAGFRCNVQLWNHRTGTKGCTLTSDSTSLVRTCAMKDGLVVASRECGRVDVWDQQSGQLISRLEANHRASNRWTNRRTPCVIAGNKIVTCSEKGNVAVWDAKSGACLYQRLFGPSFSYIQEADLALVGDVVCVWEGNKVAFCQLSAGNEFHTIRGCSIAGPDSLSVRDGFLYIGTTSGIVVTYSLSTGASQGYSHISGRNLISCSLDRGLLVAGNRNTGKVSVRNGSDFTEIFSIDTKSNENDYLKSCHVANDCIYTFGKEGVVKVWSLYTGALVQELAANHPAYCCHHSGTAVIQNLKMPCVSKEPSVYVWAPRSVKNIQLQSQTSTFLDRLRTKEILPKRVDPFLLTAAGVMVVFLFAGMKR